LNEVEQKKIFTINKLPNKDGRSRFNEVYIKRGSEGQVYGVEVSPYEYFTFTTERIEKDAMSFYQMVYGDYRKSLETFIADMRLSKIGQGEWVRLVFENLKESYQRTCSRNLNMNILILYTPILRKYKPIKTNTMKNTLLIIVILLSFSMKLQAQVREAEEVVDYAAIEADVVYHEEQYGYITEIERIQN
jgi:hypothetical protein